MDQERSLEQLELVKLLVCSGVRSCGPFACLGAVLMVALEAVAC